MENLDKVKKFQLKNKNKAIYIIVCLIFIFFSFFITVPYIEQKTVISEKILTEALINENNKILFQPIENTYFPQYNGSYILWYTKNFDDKRYLQSEKVIKTYFSNQLVLYETNNSRVLSIVEGKRPLKFRGIETQSYYYSIMLIIYNMIIAILAYPLFTVYKNQIKLLWKTQNIISSILLAITISSTFIF